MKIRKIAAVMLLVLSSFAANNVAPSKAELESMYDKAFREFNANNFPESIKQLDALDARQPDVAHSQNLRGVILMRQGSYDQAEQALQKALAIDPKFWNARFNLAEIPFLKKDWAEARNRFQGLLFGNALELQGEALQLIQYKILLTYLLENKENMVDSILTKLELTPDTPAVHYANAAIAFQKKNEKEAKDWVTAAEKNFTPQLNKLFAESLYEVGWLQKPAGQTRPAVELTSTADRVEKAKGLARAKFDQAEQAFAQRDLTAARKFVDEADAADPNQAAYINLRGEILLAQKDFDAAEAAFKQAAKVDPKFREAQFNLAQIPFKKNDYAKARERYEALFNSTPAPSANAGKDQTAQLIKFKVFLTLLLEGKDSRAQKMMEQFQFTGDTPALYYAQAAWEFKHNNPAKANDWVTSARKIYAPAMNMVFADAFYDLGWLQNVAAAPAVAAGGNEVAKVDASPAIEPSPIPGAAVAAKQGAAPAPQKTPGSDKDKTVAGMEATTERSPIAAAQPAAEKTSNAAAAPPSPNVQAPVAANALPAASRTASEQVPPASQPTVAVAKEFPAASAAPAASQAAAPLAKSSPVVVAAAASPLPSASAIAAAAASASPATVLAPATVREWSKPSTSETLEGLMNSHTLLVGGLLLAGILILAWQALPVIRRRMASASSRSTAPVARPRFATAAGPEVEPIVAARSPLAGGPRQISLQLKASEPSVRRAAVPFSKGPKAFGAPSGVAVAEPTEITAPHVIPEPVTADEDAFLDSVSEPSEIVKQEVQASAEALTAPAEIAVESTPLVAHEVSAMENTPAAVDFQPIPSIADFVPVAQPEDVAVTALLEPERQELAQASVEAFDPEVQTPPSSATTAPGVEAQPDAAEQMTPALPTLAASEPENFEPIGQGQPIPYLVSPEPASEPIAETTTPEPSRIAEGVAAGAALTGIGALRHSVESPSFAPTVVSIEPSNQQPKPPATMPPLPTQSSPAPAIRTASQPPMSGAAPQAQPQTAGGMQTAVQLTLSFEIASLQLTPSFKMGALQLRPTSRIVTMRLAPSQQPQPAMNLQVTFEIASVQVAGGALGTLRLTPSQQQRPTVAGTSSFNIAGLQMLSGSDAGAVQLTPAQQGQGSVQLTARFQIATVEFSPSFEIAALVLNSASRSVSVQLPGSQGPIESAPVFDISNVQLGGGGEIAMIQLNPQGGGAPRPA